MSEEASIFVARPSDLDALSTHWAEVQQGRTKTIRLQGPFGGGRRALAGEFFRKVASAEDGTIIWRVPCLDQENGLQWLVRMYGSLIAILSQDPLVRGKVEMVLNAQIPSQPKRVQNWYQQFIAAMKEAKADKETGQIQLRMPQDNPLVGLVEVVVGISRKIPIILELQNAYAVHSLALPLFVEGVHTEANTRDAKVFQIVYDEPESDVTKVLFPRPLLDMYERRDDIETVAIAPWGADEVSSYLSSKGIEANAARLAEIARGRPGFIAEVVDILTDRNELTGELEGITLSSLVPLEVDESELDIPSEPPGEGDRKHATPDDIGRITFFAALLGPAFPSNLVADMGNFDRDSIDDLLDAMSDLFEEVQFSEELGTWIYRFSRGSFHEGILERNDNDEGHGLARGVGQFMERYLVPRGYGFIVKTAKVYAEHGAPQQAEVMRANILTQDSADVWGLSYDLMRYFDELKFPDTMRRTVFMNLLDRLVANGNLQVADRVHTEVTEWATEHEDRDLTAWLLFNGSKLDLRRQDLFRARERANDALKLYEAKENNRRMAEIRNHLAAVELQDGNLQTALDHADEAEKLGKVKLENEQEAQMVDIAATVAQIRGLAARQSQPPKLEEAIEHFKNANQIAGQHGVTGIALDSGLSYGEALLAARQFEAGRDALRRVVEIAQALRNPRREHTACELLAQVEGVLNNPAEALPPAQRALELARQMNLEQALPADLYHVGLFQLRTNKPIEARTHLEEARQRSAQLGKHPIVRQIHFFLGATYRALKEWDLAEQTLNQALAMYREANTPREIASTLDQLADVAVAKGQKDQAATFLDEALELAKANELVEERKALKKKRDSLK
ncbi:MAG: tetratricopeptide repeat protein [Myxococcota bacterium]